MSIISTIDCTLRDGGYLNNWEFDQNFQVSLIKALINSNIDIIECGFINENSGNDNFGTHFKSIEKANSILKDNSLNKSCAKFAVMMRLNEYNPDKMPICDKAENCISIIRIMVSKEELSYAPQIIQKIIKKGYKVHIQPTIISYYTDEDIVKMLQHFQSIKYQAIAIVDTFGAVDETAIKRITLLFDKYANKEAHLSLHCHNNLAQGLQNAYAFCSSVNLNRDLYIDSAVNGLGRGAGNIATEILLTHLKNKKNANYLILPINEFCQKSMQNFKQTICRNNLYAYIITAKKNMHPNYATYLILNNYSRQDICKILQIITPEKYYKFDYNYIKSLCEVYMLKV